MGYKKIKDFLRNLINPLLPAVAFNLSAVVPSKVTCHGTKYVVDELPKSWIYQYVVTINNKKYYVGENNILYESSIKALMSEMSTFSFVVTSSILFIVGMLLPIIAKSISALYHSCILQ